MSVVLCTLKGVKPLSSVIARDHVREPLFAIVPYFNPWRWKSRVKHTERAIRHFAESGAVVVLVEVAFNRREAVFADSGLDGTAANCSIHGEFRHKYIGLRTKDELWLKENAINLGVQSLPYDWQQICWLDSDVHFVRPNWVGECIQKLQHYSWLQMFSQARDLSPTYEMMPETYPHANGVSFLQSYLDGDLDANLKKGWTRPPDWQKVTADLAQVQGDISRLSSDVQKVLSDLEDDYYGGAGPRRVFPGLAWACTREAFDAVGGLLDVAIWGGADWHMSHALVNRTENMMHSALHPAYKNVVTAWHRMSQTAKIRGNVGVMEGAVFHSWHGKKTSRGYGDKHRVLARLQFDPTQHLKRDSQGLWQLHDDGSDTFVALRESFRRIALERNEDSIDV